MPSFVLHPKQTEKSWWGADVVRHRQAIRSRTAEGRKQLPVVANGTLSHWENLRFVFLGWASHWVSYPPIPTRIRVVVRVVVFYSNSTWKQKSHVGSWGYKETFCKLASTTVKGIHIHRLPTYHLPGPQEVQSCRRHNAWLQIPTVGRILGDHLTRSQHFL
jgi:hypothetical protein